MSNNMLIFPSCVTVTQVHTTSSEVVHTMKRKVKKIKKNKKEKESKKWTLKKKKKLRPNMKAFDSTGVTQPSLSAAQEKH